LIESLFYALILVSAVIVAIGFDKKKAAFIAFGGLLLMMCGLLLMDTSPTSGIEKDYGTFVRYIGDNNYNVDVNVGYLNAGNDNTLLILSNVFFYGSFVLLLGSFAVMVAEYRASKRRGQP